MSCKHSLSSNDAIIIDQLKKIKLLNDDSTSFSINRSTRSKNFKTSNVIVSVKEIISAKVQSKKIFTQKIIIKMLISLKNQHDFNHEKVIFLNNTIKKSVLALYCKTKKTEFISHLWAEFLNEIQTLKDQIELNVFDNTLFEEEVVAINLRNNVSIFSSLIIEKEALWSKNNLQAFISNAARNQEEVFIKDFAIAMNNSNILKSQALSLRKKVFALNKQINAYEKTADQMNISKQSSSKKISLNKHEMIYIENVLTLSRKKVQQYIVNHEKHLMITAEKLKSEMTDLAVYVHHAEKRLRNLIQLKMTTDLKLCHNIKQFNKFKMSVW